MGHKRQTLVGERRLATFGRSDGAARSERVDAGGQARQLPRDSILVEHTLGDRPVQLGLRQLKGVSGRRLVTARDRHFDLLDESAHSARPGTVDRRAFGDLPYALFRRFVTRHARSR